LLKVPEAVSHFYPGLYANSICCSHCLVEVPVIAIFTKMDALDKKAFNELKNQGKSFKDAKREAPECAATMFENNYLRKLDEVKYRPSKTVQFRGMCWI
jgi:hypothetical protein